MNQPDQLGPYRIESVLGKGGMGRVYRATHHETGEAVAIKALSPQLAMNDGFIERFRAEIDSLRRLRHASIVRLFGYGQEGDLLFYAMELVDGPSLDNEIRQGRRFDWREVTDIAAQLCRALQHAHDHGIVHRDIKPANILVAPSGQIKLADFGIARLFGGSQLTVAGGVIGTADYMSPEQVSGESVTPQCDQYSLGGVMYTLLAGRPPFVSKSLPEMLQMQRYDTPEPVRRYAPDTPEQLEETIMQMLSKAPDDRFPNTRVLARHLEAMRLALSRPPTAEDDQWLGDLSMTRPVGPSDITRPYDMLSGRDTTEHSLDLPLDLPSDDDSATPVTSAMVTGAGHREQSTVVAIEKGSGGPVPKTSLFTEVHDERPAETGAGWVPAAQGIVALAVLVLVGWLAYGWLAPPGADALHATIDEVLTTGGADSLRTAAPHVDSFLARFPDDPRAAELRSVQQAIEADRHQRRLKLKLLLRRGPDTAAPPVEQLYLAAMQRAATSPAAAIDQLQALVTLIETGAATDAADEFQQEYAALARRQIEQLRQAAEAEQAAHRPFIESQLARAKELAADQPTEARRLCEAIVALYADRPWAMEFLANARSLAERLATVDSEAVP